MISPKIWPCIHPFFPKYAPVSTPSSYCIGYRAILTTGPSYYPKCTLCTCFSVKTVSTDFSGNIHRKCLIFSLTSIYQIICIYIFLDGLAQHLLLQVVNQVPILPPCPKFLVLPSNDTGKTQSHSSKPLLCRIYTHNVLYFDMENVATRHFLRFFFNVSERSTNIIIFMVLFADSPNRELLAL